LKPARFSPSSSQQSEVSFKFDGDTDASMMDSSVDIEPKENFDYENVMGSYNP